MEDQGDYIEVEKIRFKKNLKWKPINDPNPPLLIPKNFNIQSGRKIHSSTISYVASFNLNQKLDGRYSHAIKRIQLTTNRSLHTAFRELGNLLAAKGHKHVVKLISAYSPEKWSEGPSRLEQLYFVFPDIEMDLSEFIGHKQSFRGGFTHVTISRITAQLIDALIYMHEKCHVIHRDLKPMNVGVTNTSKGDEALFVMLFDFGHSAACHPAELGGLQPGTVNYCSPESFIGLEVEAPTDVWSLGCILGEMTQATTVVYDITRGRRGRDVSIPIPLFPPYEPSADGRPMPFNRIWHLKNILCRLDLIDDKWFEEPETSQKISRDVMTCLRDMHQREKEFPLLPEPLSISGVDVERDERLKELITALLNPNPSKRMTLREARESTYIQEVGHDFHDTLNPEKLWYTAKDDESAEQSEEHWKKKIVEMLKEHPEWKTMYGPSTEQDSQAGSSKA